MRAMHAGRQTFAATWHPNRWPSIRVLNFHRLTVDERGRLRPNVCVCVHRWDPEVLCGRGRETKWRCLQTLLSINLSFPTKQVFVECARDVGESQIRAMRVFSSLSAFNFFCRDHKSRIFLLHSFCLVMTSCFRYRKSSESMPSCTVNNMCFQRAQFYFHNWWKSFCQNK